MDGSLEICSSLNDGINRQISQMIYKLLPLFYGLLPVSEDKRIDLIASQLKTENTELFYTKAFLKKNKVLGIYTSFPSESLKALQMGSAMVFLKYLHSDNKNKYLKDLKEYSEKISDVPKNCYYLSRISVAESEQGSGVASFLLEQFFHEGKDFKLFGLHVHKENFRAIHFFEKNGFKRFDCPDMRFDVMIRNNRI
jgi:ribosomal protein S18 acetylase RimI-like enzyme